MFLQLLLGPSYQILDLALIFEQKWLFIFDKTSLMGYSIILSRILWLNGKFWGTSSENYIWKILFIANLLQVASEMLEKSFLSSISPIMCQTFWENHLKLDILKWYLKNFQFPFENKFNDDEIFQVRCSFIGDSFQPHPQWDCSSDFLLDFELKIIQHITSYMKINVYIDVML